MKPITEMKDIVDFSVGGTPITYKLPIFTGKWECEECGVIYDTNLDVCERCGHTE